ncbi:tyrosinase family protein [Pseudomonas purpurea]|uniref:DUF7868 domain-containing protein n=1 Tax=Pseudomonas purpurea TaxID=3136737 RepID=UPI003265BF16
MAHVRRDVWKLDSGWNDTLKWYARGVEELQKRPFTDRTSWCYLAAIHGFDKSIWISAGYMHATTALPPKADQALYWDQCQHSTWYFLPWHRGYVAAFEQIVRAAIVGLGGPQDWALPYWNYNEGAQSLHLPPCFAEKTLPTGGRNPLYVERRYGLSGNGNVVLDPSQIGLAALDDPVFEGPLEGIPPGFGGPATVFNHDGSGGSGANIEQTPHNVVHVEVGFKSAKFPHTLGLMTDPDTAALDPIFWLHHANIDRLWEVWLKNNPHHQNPDDPAWYNGPPAGGRVFIVPTTQGTAWQFKVGDMLNTLSPKLDYRYEDTGVTVAAEPLVKQRLARLGASKDLLKTFSTKGLIAPQGGPTELIGTNDAALDLVGTSIETPVALDQAGSKKVFTSLKSKSFSATLRVPDRVFLKLENIRGKSDAVVLDVYINLPTDADPAQHADLRAGTLALFGVRKASLPDGEHGGNGVSQVFEITHIVDALHLGGVTSAAQLKVRFVSASPIPPEDQISVGSVSIYRLGD